MTDKRPEVQSYSIPAWDCPDCGDVHGGGGQVSAEMQHPALAWVEKYRHRVPDDAVVLDGVEVAAFMPDGTPLGISKFSWRHPSSYLRYTAEPIEPPRPKPKVGEIRFAPEGSRYLYAALVDATHSSLTWMVALKEGRYSWITDEVVADWPLARLVPNGNGEMDEDNKANRVTIDGDQVWWWQRRDVWCVEDGNEYGTLAALVKEECVTLSFEEEEE